MNIISHRGYWLSPEERNTSPAFKRSFDLGYGTETDIRDCAGELVISHDMPFGNEMTVEEMLAIYKESGCEAVLALNIKSDGLQKPLKKLLDNFKITNYFLFDMAVPDAVVSIKEGMVCYTRQSEYERDSSFYKQASGVWMDEFYNDWIAIEHLQQHLNHKKKICIVSPDLHKKDHIPKWKYYKNINSIYDLSEVTLCTDLPEKAEEFINGKN